MKTKTIILDALPTQPIVFDKSGQHATFLFNNLSGLLHIIIRAPDVNIKIFGLYNNLDSHKLETVQEHQVGKSTSQLLVKAAMRGQASLDYTGVIKIAAHAQQTQTYQKCQALMLSEQAKVSFAPQLEILAHQVQATHSVVASPPDAQMLWYLRSRGLSHLQAVELIEQGFIDEIYNLANA